MARLSSILLACACAVLCCSALVRGANVLSLTATYDYQAMPRTLDNGGTTFTDMDVVTFTVTLSSGATGVGESITMSCTDSADPPASVGSFSPMNPFTVNFGSSTGTIMWTPSAVAVLPVRCTAIGDLNYLTRSDEFLLYNGMRWATSIDANPLAAGQATTLRAEVYPAEAVSMSGGTTVTFSASCEILPILDGGLSTASHQVLVGESLTTWSLTGPAVPQSTLTCTITRSGGMSSTPTTQTVVVDMTMPTVTWDASWPSVIHIGQDYDVELTLSQPSSGSLSLQSTCQSSGQPATDFGLSGFMFLNTEQTKTFTISAGYFVTPMSDVQCRVWWASGDAFFTNLAMNVWQPATHAFSIVDAESSTGGQIDPESSTGDSMQSGSTAAQQQSESSTASQQQSVSSTASQQQSVSSSASQQSVSSSASVATSSGQNGGASSSTGAPCIPGLTCAAVSAHASWAILALALAAVFGALRQ